ncbi:MAG: endopeptidase La [Herpetosiphon sp.]
MNETEQHDVVNTDQQSEERTLPMVILGEMVIMPRIPVPLQVAKGKSYRAMEDAMQGDKEVLLIFVPEAEIEGFKGTERQTLPPVGVIARLQEFSKRPDDTVQIILEGLVRAKIGDYVQSDPFYRVTCQATPDAEVTGSETEALMSEVKSQVEEIIGYMPDVSQEAVAFVKRIDFPGHLADVVAYGPEFEFEDRLALLYTLDPMERLTNVQRELSHQLELLRLRQKIQSETKDALDQSQKEYFLREQMKAIRRELGEDEFEEDPVDELKRKILELDAPDYVKEAATHELKRLIQQGMNSPESGVIRTYVDWILNLPWAKEQQQAIVLSEAQKILDEDHYGLEKVKERIIEYLAVRKLAGERMRSPILCFVGPPGVGKTSLGKSVARALGRRFVRASLGGVRDEAEIRGHRRTYIGAMPGRVIQSLKTAKSNQPVFILDEIDKLGADYRGDPTSALLEVLDPEQNNTFSDHYLEIPFDLSQVIFIATANQLDPIPMPLRDRMEVIELGGYTEDEKLEIARGFLVTKQREFHGLGQDQLTLTDEALLKLIRFYTREAGVRNLEREIAALCRKVARKVADTDEPTSITIDAATIPDYLGPEKYSFGQAEAHDEIGVATGAVYTVAGGDLLQFEVLPLLGKGELRLTGQLGDVMRESAMAALSYARYRSADFGVAASYFEEHAIHIHVPEGAVPKDGPSAGITLTTALVSAMTGRAVRKDVAMTGEITLRGKVLPIGGLKEKTMAAHRAGIKTFILPQENAKDIVELPEKVRRELELIPVENMDQVLAIALQPLVVAAPVLVPTVVAIA